MSTISFSVEDELKRDINTWAKRAKKSKSDLFRDMAVVYGTHEQIDHFTDKTESILAKLGIVSEAELYEYLESNETYQDRIRHQRLPGGMQKK